MKTGLIIGAFNVCLLIASTSHPVVWISESSLLDYALARAAHERERALERSIVRTYLHKIKGDRAENDLRLRNISIDVSKDSGMVCLETTVYGNREELVNPEATLLPAEKEKTLRGKLLLAAALQRATDRSSVIKLGERTKCYAPVYYDNNRGWMMFVTMIPKQEFDAACKLVEKKQCEKPAQNNSPTRIIPFAQIFKKEAFCFA